MTRTEVLSDEMWARIEQVLPAVKGSMGRPMRGHRPLVEGAIYRYRTGIAWRDLPAEFGPWQTVWKRHRGGLTTKTHALVDGHGLPLVIALTPGQAGNSTALRQLLAELRVPRLGPGRPRSRPGALRGDKAYSARAHRPRIHPPVAVMTYETRPRAPNPVHGGSPGITPPSKVNEVDGSPES